jgi:hypothetical protein
MTEDEKWYAGCALQGLSSKMWSGDVDAAFKLVSTAALLGRMMMQCQDMTEAELLAAARTFVARRQ